MNTFSVINFEKFQHYKNRSPPWIKLYNSLLDDYHFCALPDASKMHLVAIWLLASRFDNEIPHDPVWIGGRINATEPVNLGILAQSGFIKVNHIVKSNGYHDDSALLADRKQSAYPEREERHK